MPYSLSNIQPIKKTGQQKQVVELIQISNCPPRVKLLQLSQRGELALAVHPERGDRGSCWPTFRKRYEK